MQVAGVTQYLTKVQGMPQNVEDELNKQIRRFMWNNEKTDTVNQSQMYATHKKGGKKVVDIRTRNKAINLTWLKAYLNLDENRATWMYFAHAMIREDIPPSHEIDKDPESRIMPIIQDWNTRATGSTLPDDLKSMLKLVRELNVQMSATNPTREIQLQLPIWYHVRSAPSAWKLYKKKTAKCLRRKHNVKLVKDALRIIEQITDEHVPQNNCKCDRCKKLRTEAKCTHPHECMALTTNLVKKIYPKWNPTVERQPPTRNDVSDNRGQEI